VQGARSYIYHGPLQFRMTENATRRSGWSLQNYMAPEQERTIWMDIDRTPEWALAMDGLLDGKWKATSWW
jgi:hypothetical protein